MYWFLLDDGGEIKNAKTINKNVATTSHSKYIKMFCWLINVWDIEWKESKQKIIELEPMKSSTFM